jgi:hypothetical protein
MRDSKRTRSATDNQPSRRSHARVRTYGDAVFRSRSCCLRKLTSSLRLFRVSVRRGVSLRDRYYSEIRLCRRGASGERARPVTGINFTLNNIRSDGRSVLIRRCLMKMETARSHRTSEYYIFISLLFLFCWIKLSVWPNAISSMYPETTCRAMCTVNGASCVHAREVNSLCASYFLQAVCVYTHSVYIYIYI